MITRAMMFPPPATWFRGWLGNFSREPPQALNAVSLSATNFLQGRRCAMSRHPLFQRSLQQVGKSFDSGVVLSLPRAPKRFCERQPARRSQKIKLEFPIWPLRSVASYNSETALEANFFIASVAHHDTRNGTRTAAEGTTPPTFSRASSKIQSLVSPRELNRVRKNLGL